MSKEYVPASYHLREVTELEDRISRLQAALRKARVHVHTSNEAEHMMDGFGPRSHQHSDDLLSEIDRALDGQ